MHTLTTEQQSMLIEIVNEEFGSDLDFKVFSDALLGLFEDIAGFETISQSKSTRIIKLLWSQYHGQVQQET